MRGGALEADQREVSLGYCCAQRNPPAFSTPPEERGVENKRSCLLNGPRAALDCQHFLLTTSLSCRAASTPTALPRSRCRCRRRRCFAGSVARLSCYRSLCVNVKCKMSKHSEGILETSKSFVSCLSPRLIGRIQNKPSCILWIAKKRRSHFE